jgi:hypothetical protein
MKNSIAALAIIIGLTVTACKGNPEGAMGANDKADTTVFDRESEATGRPEATRSEAVKGDTSKGSIGPGKDKYHVTDSENEKKH